MMAKTEPRDEDRPISFRARMLTFLLAVVALSAFSAAAGAAGGLIFDPTGWGRGTLIGVAVLVLIGGSAIWGLMRLRPLTGADDPVSPQTRRTNNLFALSGVVTVPGVLALYIATFSEDEPFAMFSNGPVATGVALFAIAGWLLGMAIGWWWYACADEHERQAYDFGSLVGAGLFTTVTPAWWVAARAGLMPQPDAMLLWSITMIAVSIAWFWRRSP